jgi:hypothetical protein
MDRMYYRTPSVRDQRFEGVLIDEIDRADGEQREAAGHPQLTRVRDHCERFEQSHREDPVASSCHYDERGAQKSNSGCAFFAGNDGTLPARHTNLARVRTAYLVALALDAIAWQAWWRPEDLTT